MAPHSNAIAELTRYWIQALRESDQRVSSCVGALWHEQHRSARERPDETARKLPDENTAQRVIVEAEVEHNYIQAGRGFAKFLRAI